MGRYYVELAAIERGASIPFTVEAANPAEGQEKAVQIFGDKFRPRYAEVLSKAASELFVTLDRWPSDTQPISPEIFRTTVAHLLKEGAAIADRQWSAREYSLISPKAEYANTTIDDMTELMNCPPTEIHGCLYYVFHKNEARMFMSLIIREGIARRLRDLVKEN